MINYTHLADSVTYYRNNGFKRIESPWTVTKSVMEITKPPQAKIDYQLLHNNKCLVASGEQSYLYLYLKDYLPKGCFQTITPCFRYEDFDFLHSKYFIKNELIDTEEVTEGRLHEIIDIARGFFNRYFKEGVRVKNVSPNGQIMYDITYNGIELGSYGIRKCEFLTWIYGTGVAEPRLSRVLDGLYNGIP